MNQRAAHFSIKKENFAAALAAIKALADKLEQMGGGSSSGERWYAWVNTESFLSADTLEKAIGAWRWHPYVNEETGNIEDISFEGEKLGDDFILLKALAPYVEAGSYIEMEGEDGSIWRWAFDGKGVVELAGKVTFE